MKRFLLMAVLLLVCSAAFADNDPCAASNATKQSASLAFSTTTTAVLIASAPGKTTYVCSMNFTMSSGTTPTLAFKSGTGTTCGTNTVTLTGTMALSTTSGTLYTIGQGHTLFSASNSTDLCITTGGTSPTGNGWITYVQQ